MRKLTLIIFMVLLCCLIGSLPEASAKIKFLELYQGLPNYDKNPPFVNRDLIQNLKLEEDLLKVKPSENRCNAGSVLVSKAPLYAGDKSGKDWRVDLSTNICDKNELSNIKTLIGKLAPSLVLDNMTAWITNLDGDRESDLIVGYIDISNGEVKYPYFSTMPRSQT